MLIKINGIQNYEQLKNIKDKLKSNLRKIQCNLGDVKNGHLGLVLMNTEYTSVSLITYAHSIHPSRIPLIGGRSKATALLRERHNEQIKLFQEANAVKERLLN